MLTSTADVIPIYEAKMTGDSRLVVCGPFLHLSVIICRYWFFFQYRIGVQYEYERNVSVLLVDSHSVRSNNMLNYSLDGNPRRDCVFSMHMKG